MLRTHTCGELREKNLDQTATLCGWVQKARDHGGKIFVDLRDRYGITQCVFDPSHKKELHAQAEKLGREWVITVTGKIRKRPEGMQNPNLPTGMIELLADKLELLNKSEIPPIEIDDRKVAGEDARLKYRYLDLRRPQMQKQIITRHKMAQAARQYLSSKGFLEIETPFLVRNTPEGARDFIVPSRVHHGKVYSLPQSPQLYKQILMVAGFDRYFQLARCFRDEDLRQDRQPEFTQIDIEMSYITKEDIIEITEGVIKACFKEVNIEVTTPFERMTYQKAMDLYGSDKPDLRYEMEMINVTEECKNSTFQMFTQAIEKGATVKCINAKKCANFTRKELDELVAVAQANGAKGLAYVTIDDKGNLEGNLAKYFENVKHALIVKTGAKPGDLLCFVADQWKKACTAMGAVRKHLAEKTGQIRNELKFLWVIDFPLYEWSEEEQRWSAMHHLFTSPKKEDIAKLETKPGEVLSDAYDIVLNGTEIGGGSIRINNEELQKKAMKPAAITIEQAKQKFGFLLEALQYGAPPHGGLAIGFDRFVALAQGIVDIREVIAFPKNKAAQNPMDECPSEPDAQALKEIGIKFEGKPNDKQKSI